MEAEKSASGPKGKQEFHDADETFDPIEEGSIKSDDTRVMMDAPEEDEETQEKSFLGRVTDLIDALRSVDEFDKDPGLSSFQAVVTTIQRKEGEQRVNLEEAMKLIFEKFYMVHQAEFVEEKLDFLSNGTEVISFGRSGKANIPICAVYTSLCENNPELIDTVEGCIYFVLQHVCPDEDLDSILEICREFEPETYATGNNFIDFVGNIVGRVSDKLGSNDDINLETEDGKMDVNAIGTVVQDLIGDNVIQGSMQNMMQSITNDDFDINSVFSGLMNMGNSANGK